MPTILLQMFLLAKQTCNKLAKILQKFKFYWPVNQPSSTANQFEEFCMWMFFCFFLMKKKRNKNKSKAWTVLQEDVPFEIQVFKHR